VLGAGLVVGLVLQGGFVLRGATLVEGDARRAARDLWVADGRIAAETAAGELPGREGVREIDAAGRFAIPGLWDLHVHPDDPEVWHLEPKAREKEKFLGAFVRAGVTGVRDMGGDLALLQSWRTRIEAGELVGPRIVACGPLVDGPEPMWPGSLAVDGPEAGRRAVDELALRGADFVKVYSLLGLESLTAIGERARERGLAFAGHVPLGVSPLDASRLGMASQEHLLEMVRHLSDPERARALALERPMPDDRAQARDARTMIWLETQSEERLRELCEVFKTQGTRVVPTLTMWRRRAWYDAQDPDVVRWRAILPEHIRLWWQPEHNIHLRDDSPGTRATRQALFARYVEIVRALHAAGVEVLPGTDTGGNPNLVPGWSLHDELELLVVWCGMTPAEALSAATAGAARLAGRGDETGSLAAGRRADLVLLAADPSLDIAATRAIVGVAANGRWLDRAALDALQAELAR
jgi:imidazolonepropionase-like amidohydrolase